MDAAQKKLLEVHGLEVRCLVSEFLLRKPCRSEPKTMDTAIMLRELSDFLYESAKDLRPLGYKARVPNGFLQWTIRSGRDTFHKQSFDEAKAQCVSQTQAKLNALKNNREMLTLNIASCEEALIRLASLTADQIELDDGERA